VLINIGHSDILPKLFGKVTIPPEVLSELAHANRPKMVRDFVAARPAWLQERSPTTVEAIPSLHPGELAAINLARELMQTYCSSTTRAGAKPHKLGISQSPARLALSKQRRNEGCLIWETRLIA